MAQSGQSIPSTHHAQADLEPSPPTAIPVISASCPQDGADGLSLASQEKTRQERPGAGSVEQGRRKDRQHGQAYHSQGRREREPQPPEIRMESNFHSTVLQRPPSLHDYEDQQRDRDRERERERERGSSERRHRDILNPVQQGDSSSSNINNTNPPPASGSHAPGQQQQHPHQPPPPPRHSFSLRSPTQPDFHHAAPPHFPGTSSASPSSAPSASAAATTNASTSTSTGTNGTGPGTRSLLHNPFLTSSAAPPSLPPPVHPSSIAPPRSPLHAPPVFYPQDMRDHRESPREKTAGSFYDPTTDTTTSTSDRRVSDSGPAWHNATQASTASSASKVSKTSPQEAERAQSSNQAWLPGCLNACTPARLDACCLHGGGRQRFSFLTGANASGTRQTTPLHNRAMLATLTGPATAAGPSGPSCSSQDTPIVKLSKPANPSPPKNDHHYPRL